MARIAKSDLVDHVGVAAHAAPGRQRRIDIDRRPARDETLRKTKDGGRLIESQADPFAGFTGFISPPASGPAVEDFE